MNNRTVDKKALAVELWRRVALGQATEQDKIDVAGRATVLNDLSRLPDLLELLRDESENVCYFVLEDLVASVGGTIYELLFKIAGRPPSERLGVDAPRDWLLNPEIDWTRVAELEDSLERP